VTCQECLAELATGSLRELNAGSRVVQHCATCPDCGPLATQLRDREYDAATLLNNLRPLGIPAAVAEQAAMFARRRRVGKVVVFIAGAAMVATIWISLFVTSFGRSLMSGPRPSAQHVESIALSCLSPEQAGDIISPYIRSQGSAYYVSRSGLSVITVRGTADEVATARRLILDFERDPRARCRNPAAEKTQTELQKASGPVLAPTDKVPTAAKRTP